MGNVIRTDPFNGGKVVVAAGRYARPGSVFTVAEPPVIDQQRDPFAEGNEALTPPELSAFRADGLAADTPGWSVRVVPNLYPTFTVDAPEVEVDVQRDLFYSQPASGSHEVIINSPQPVTSLSDLSLPQLELALQMWQQRIQAHSGAAYRHLIVNEQAGAGASLPHTHAQLFVMNFVPAVVARERERYGAHATRTNGGNLAADLLQEEVRRNQRIIEVDQDCVLLTPYASANPYQMMILPRKVQSDFAANGRVAAGLLHSGLLRLRRLLGHSPPLNIWVRTAPAGADYFCWRIEIAPRLTHLAGLELGCGLGVNIVAPELAAQQLREI